MALVLGSAVLAGGFLIYNSSIYSKRKKPVHSEQKRGDEAALSYKHTGTYGDIKDIWYSLHIPGFIVSVHEGQDLSGAPCRWLTARTGAVYRTYDMHTDFMKLV